MKRHGGGGPSNTHMVVTQIFLYILKQWYNNDISHVYSLDIFFTVVKRIFFFVGEYSIIYILGLVFLRFKG